MNSFEKPETNKNTETVKEFSEAERQELINLRKRQLDGPWSETDRQRLLELVSREEAVRGVALSLAEKEMYLDLTRRQTESKDWTAADAEKLFVLQRRLDAGKPKHPRF